MPYKPRIAACIPAYNEEEHIAAVIVKAQKYVDEVIVCDDGSSDLTGEIAAKLGARIIKHERNMGYGVAIRTLLDACREMNFDIAITIDGDGQHDPDDIPKLLEPITRNEADIVIGSRFIAGLNDEAPSYRKLGIKAITKFLNTSAKSEILDAQSGFRAYNRTALQAIRPAEMGMGVSTEILMKALNAGLRVKEVPIKVRYGEKTSTHNPLFHGLDVLLATVKHLSIRHPLLFYGVPALAALLIGLIFWIWTFQIFAATRQVVTNITLVAIGATVVGLMLLTTSVILWVLVSLIREK